MALLKLGRYGDAEADCDAALALDARSVKALLRRGAARLARGAAEGARADFAAALALEPRNAQAAAELARLDAAAAASGGF
jgi:Meckel syndrome type 1 protein